MLFNSLRHVIVVVEINDTIAAGVLCVRNGNWLFHPPCEHVRTLTSTLFPLFRSDNVSSATTHELFLTFPDSTADSNDLHDALHDRRAPRAWHFSYVGQGGPHQAEVLARTAHDGGRRRGRKVHNLQRCGGQTDADITEMRGD